MTEETYQKILSDIRNMTDEDYEKMLKEAREMDKDRERQFGANSFNPWHTGTPTEEGWYLVAVLFDGEIEYQARECYRTLDNDNNPCMRFSGTLPVLAWQRITPYEPREEK